MAKKNKSSKTQVQVQTQPVPEISQVEVQPEKDNGLVLTCDFRKVGKDPQTGRDRMTCQVRDRDLIVLHPAGTRFRYVEVKEPAATHGQWHLIVEPSGLPGWSAWIEERQNEYADGRREGLEPIIAGVGPTLTGKLAILPVYDHSGEYYPIYGPRLFALMSIKEVQQIHAERGENISRNEAADRRWDDPELYLLRLQGNPGLSGMFPGCLGNGAALVMERDQNGKPVRWVEVTQAAA